LDKEFLNNYSAKETEEVERILRLPLDESVQEYRKRFPRIQEPIAWSHGGMSIWPQIPLCGTLIVGLAPAAQDFANTKPFAAFLGFDPEDVPQLVDFARNTGKVAFVLSKDPKEYAGLGFLDPIFLELKPPRAVATFPYTPQEAKRFRLKKAEFETLARNNVYKDMEKMEASPLRKMLGPGYDFQHAFRATANTYAILDYLGYRDLTNLVSDALLEPDAGNSQVQMARVLLGLYGELIVTPSTELLKGIHNMNLAGYLDPTSLLLGKDNADRGISSLLPRSFEIGKFLMKKLIPYPIGFEACRAMCDRYDHYDLQHVLSSLQQAARVADYSEIHDETKNLTDVLENAWRDCKKVGTRQKMFSFGIPMAMAILGTAAGGLTGPYGGLLAGLGFALGEKFIEIKTDSISERIAKHFAQSYLVNIFDFRKKYTV
jgi:hypothetical protein